MKHKKILHILSPDKFTIPFVQFINKEFDSNNHIFLFVAEPDENVLAANKNVRFLNSRYRNNIFRNLAIFYSCITASSKIILHGNPVLFYFMLFPFILKKTYWIIYGYELGDSTKENGINVEEYINSFIKRFVLKRIYGHITHIRGDSQLANNRFKSSAKYFYSPVYLSNVATDCQPEITHLINSKKVRNILVGNSTSPTNNHIDIFNMLLQYKEDDIVIYCPLSYGIFLDYRDEVIRIGKELFGVKFIPLLDFMTIENYRLFLSDIDIAIFNHNRQEAMGVTVSLLALKKIVYMKPGTTAYLSLVERGIKVFDNTIIKNGELYKDRDVSVNICKIHEYYSVDVLKKSLNDIFNYS